MERRTFVKNAAGLAAAATVLAPASAIGANETIRVAVLGVNGRGRSHINGLQPLENVEITTLVDPDLEVGRKRAAEFEQKYGKKVKVVQDMRTVFDDKDIDAVTIATPNHWHTLAAIWACQAGKDVYVEKPSTHCYNEGHSLIAAAKKYNRIVQHGVQLRSSEAIQEAVQQMNDGIIGDVYMARATIFKWRPPLEKYPDEEPPATLDYGMWVGPGKWRAYSKRHVHYNWHWTWDFGNGEIGNQGIHETDMLQWGLGVKQPTRLTSMGGRYLWNDHRETPELLTTLMEFDEGGRKKFGEVAVRFWCSNRETEQPNGNLFYGSEGHLVISNYTKYQFFFGQKGEPGPSGEAPTRHFENFIKAVRSRKTSDQNGPVEQAHHAAGMAHLGNITYQRNKVLEFDPKAERFTNDDMANEMLGQKYRKGFEVPAPDKV
ncbi:MAG: Gfo/Idh/MocA family oxidoreductase [Acidobacteria bacterium]|nr:Gfo/Idh/MocA family oxidoreductase [Acidobacteriota bacterium]